MIYLDNAATTRFKPLSSAKAMIKTYLNSSNYSRATHSDSLSLLTLITHFRELIRQSINLDNINKIIFTQNCSESLNMAILGYAKTQKNEFHIICSAFDHNSSLRPIHKLYKERKAYYTVIYPDKTLNIDIDLIYKSITKKTKLIVINHQSNVTSSKVNLEKLKDIATEKNVYLIVDAAQSFGHDFININGINALCIAGHKNLLGPQGVGILCLNNMDIEPIKYGGSGIKSEDLNQPNIYPDGFEVGTQNAPAIMALYESYKYVLKNKDKINKKIETLSYYLHEKLRSIPIYNIIGIKNAPCFLLQPKKAEGCELFNYLNENKILTRFGLHCAPFIHSYLNTLNSGATRISIGYNNTLDEMDQVIDILTSFNQHY